MLLGGNAFQIMLLGVIAKLGFLSFKLAKLYWSFLIAFLFLKLAKNFMLKNLLNCIAFYA
jgi:hypothetical protein